MIIRKIIKLFAKQILHFKVVMHQCNLGCNSLTALPQFFSWNLGILLLRERKEKEKRNGKRKENVGRKRKQENRKGTKVRRRKGEKGR